MSSVRFRSLNALNLRRSFKLSINKRKSEDQETISGISWHFCRIVVSMRMNDLLPQLHEWKFALKIESLAERRLPNISIRYSPAGSFLFHMQITNITQTEICYWMIQFSRCISINIHHLMRRVNLLKNIIYEIPSIINQILIYFC